MTIEEESDRATTLLAGLTVKRVIRLREQELMVEFEDGSRLYADSETALELSITRPPG